MARTSRIVNRLPQFIADRERIAASVMTYAMVRGGSEAAVLVPQDTSNLLNSMYREVGKSGTKIFGRIGFTAEYALAVHEATGKLKGQPRPKRDGKGRGVYWGPHDGQPKFLNVAFARAKSDIDAHLKKKLKTR